MSDYPEPYLFLGGRRISARHRVCSTVVNPATEEHLAQLPQATQDDVDEALRCAQDAFYGWRAIPGFERAELLRRAAVILRRDAARTARTLTLEQGRPVTEAMSEVVRAAELFEWSAEEARRTYGRVIPARSAHVRQFLLPEPVGPVAAFSGWNAPINTPARKIASALAAGCTVVAKPAEETPGSALAIAEALEEAGLPAGALSLLFGDPGQISARLLDSPVIRAVTFTGSTSIGRQIAVRAAQGLKRAVLELGGHAPVLVFEDADPVETARILISSKVRNCGQICVSPTRIMVHASILEPFTKALSAAALEVRVGSGLDATSQMGPLANPRRLKAMEDLVADAMSRGATLRAGGHRIGERGYFFAPTVLAGLTPAWHAAQTEPFGPLALVGSFTHFDEAITEANRLPFGLAAYVFTRDVTRARTATSAIESGVVCVNHMQYAFPETPFGGVKDSGLGKEGGSEGIAEFSHMKFVTET